MEITSIIDLHKVCERIAYNFHEHELNFYPTFEVSKDSYTNIQNEVRDISNQMIPAIPYEQTESWMSFMYMGVKRIIKPIQQPYKNSEIINSKD